MKRWLYISGILLLAGVLVASFVFIKMFNKQHQDLDGIAAAHALPVWELVAAFETDETQASHTYIDQVIEVRGQVASVSTSNGKCVLTLSQKETNGLVVCTMNASENKKVLGLQTGQQVTVKGICTGYLMDVMLVRGVLVNL